MSFVPPNASLSAVQPFLNLLGANPGNSVLSSLVVPNIQTYAAGLHASLTQAQNPTADYVGVPVQTGGTTNWRYVPSGSSWLATQLTFTPSVSFGAVSRTVQFANMAWFDNATNDNARAARGYTVQAAPARTSTIPSGLTATSPSSCSTTVSQLGGVQNVVFQHGLKSNACAWTRMTNWLNQDFRFNTEVVPTLSSLDPLSSQGTALINELKSVGGTNYLLIGHSQGGLISRYAAQYFQGNPPNLVTGVATLDTPHEGALLALNGAVGIYEGVQYIATLLWDLTGCNTAYDNPGCFIAALIYTTAPAFAVWGVDQAVPAVFDLIPGSPFLVQLNGQSEHFTRAAIIGNTPQRWNETRIAANAFAGCNPEESCGEESIAFDTEIFYDVVQVAFYISEFECFAGSDFACTLADYLDLILFGMDVMDSFWNSLVSIPPDGSDAIVQSSSQSYPSGSATQYAIGGADSHTGATKSRLAKDKLDTALTQTFQVPTFASCSFSLSPSGLVVGPAVASGTFNVVAGTGCLWSSVSQTPWVSVTGGPAGGGTGTVSVYTQSNCVWAASSNATWLTITSGGSGTGNGSFTFTATPNSGNASLSGTINIMGQTVTVILGSPGGTPGTGTVTVSGRARSGYDCPPGCRAKSCCSLIWESGTVAVTVGGVRFSTSYGGSTPTSSSIASALVTLLNRAGSPVSAAVAGAVITITSKVNGSLTDYSLSTSYTYDTSHFDSAAFAATPSGSQLTGGTD